MVNSYKTIKYIPRSDKGYHLPRLLILTSSSQVYFLSGTRWIISNISPEKNMNNKNMPILSQQHYKRKNVYIHYFMTKGTLCFRFGVVISV